LLTNKELKNSRQEKGQDVIENTTRENGGFFFRHDVAEKPGTYPVFANILLKTSVVSKIVDVDDL